MKFRTFVLGGLFLTAWQNTCTAYNDDFGMTTSDDDSDDTRSVCDYHSATEGDNDVVSGVKFCLVPHTRQFSRENSFGYNSFDEGTNYELSSIGSSVISNRSVISNISDISDNPDYVVRSLSPSEVASLNASWVENNDSCMSFDSDFIASAQADFNAHYALINYDDIKSLEEAVKNPACAPHLAQALEKKINNLRFKYACEEGTTSKQYALAKEFMEQSTHTSVLLAIKLFLLAARNNNEALLDLALIYLDGYWDNNGQFIDSTEFAEGFVDEAAEQGNAAAQCVKAYFLYTEKNDTAGAVKIWKKIADKAAEARIFLLLHQLDAKLETFNYLSAEDTQALFLSGASENSAVIKLILYLKALHTEKQDEWFSERQQRRGLTGGYVSFNDLFYQLLENDFEGKPVTVRLFETGRARRPSTSSE